MHFLNIRFILIIEQKMKNDHEKPIYDSLDRKKRSNYWYDPFQVLNPFTVVKVNGKQKLVSDSQNEIQV